MSILSVIMKEKDQVSMATDHRRSTKNGDTWEYVDSDKKMLRIGNRFLCGVTGAKQFGDLVFAFLREFASVSPLSELMEDIRKMPYNKLYEIHSNIILCGVNDSGGIFVWTYNTSGKESLYSNELVKLVFTVDDEIGNYCENFITQSLKFSDSYEETLRHTTAFASTMTKMVSPTCDVETIYYKS